MRTYHPLVLSAILLGLGISSASAQKELKHFIFFSRDREKIHEEKFYLNAGVRGAQISYPWRMLEPEKGKYDFREIDEDLNFLTSKGKKLFIQIQDVTFNIIYDAVPKYLMMDSVYHGGQNPQYGIRPNGEHKIRGWMSRRWDDSVAHRFHKLLQALAVRYDGRIEGINLAETALDLPELKELIPSGYSDEKYISSLKKTMSVLRSSFTKSVPLLYANFMPGGAENLKPLYEHAREIKHGMGGPDIKVYKWFQMQNSYPLISSISEVVPTGLAVQDGNFSEINPKTKKQVTMSDILDFAQNYLKLDYIFWGIEEPYYSDEVLSYLKTLKK